MNAVYRYMALPLLATFAASAYGAADEPPAPPIVPTGVVNISFNLPATAPRTNTNKFNPLRPFTYAGSTKLTICDSNGDLAPLGLYLVHSSKRTWDAYFFMSGDDNSPGVPLDVVDGVPGAAGQYAARFTFNRHGRLVGATPEVIRTEPFLPPGAEEQALEIAYFMTSYASAFNVSELAPDGVCGPPSMRATSHLWLGMNLPVDAPMLDPAQFSVTDPSTYNEATALTFCDGQSASHAVTAYFVKSEPQVWNVFFAIDGTPTTVTNDDESDERPFGTLTFTTGGILAGVGPSPMIARVPFYDSYWSSRPDGISLQFISATSREGPFELTLAEMDGRCP